MRLSTIAEPFDFMPEITSPARRALAAALAFFLFTFASPASAGCPDESYQPAPGFKKVMLSKYHPALKGTEADTPVFIQQGAKTGGVVLVAGGTHANEVSGPLAAVLFIENAKVAKGRLIVIPRANRLAFSHSAPRQRKPLVFAIDLPGGGKRFFRYGSRYSQCNGDPHTDDTTEKRRLRNLNRVYPGKADGNLTEQTAYAIVNLLRLEKVDLAIDLHEARQNSRLADLAVVHERALSYAAEVLWDLSDQGVETRLDASPKNMHGLSHREWGDHSKALAVLLETRNPLQINYRDNYASFLPKGSPRNAKLCADLDCFFTSKEGKSSLDLRVGRHVAAISAFIKGLKPFFQATEGDGSQKEVVVKGIPSFGDIGKNGVGAYLTPLPPK